MPYFIKTEFQCFDDLNDIIEESFNDCISNREEIAWLISLVRNLLNLRNRRYDFNKDNIRINWWQDNLYEPLENWKRYYNLSTSLPRQEWIKHDDYQRKETPDTCKTTHRRKKTKKRDRSFIKPSGTLF